MTFHREMRIELPVHMLLTRRTRIDSSLMAADHRMSACMMFGRSLMCFSLPLAENRHLSEIATVTACPSADVPDRRDITAPSTVARP